MTGAQFIAAGSVSRGAELFGRYSLVPRSNSGPERETGRLEVTVERECLANAVLAHERERQAVGEAHFLIGKLLEQLEGVLLLCASGAQNHERLRAQDRAGTFGGEPVTGAAGQQGKRLVEDVVTRRAG